MNVGFVLEVSASVGISSLGIGPTVVRVVTYRLYAITVFASVFASVHNSSCHMIGKIRHNYDMLMRL